MKLEFQCMHCAEERHQRLTEAGKPISVPLQELVEKQILVSIVDDNVYHFQCKKGHDNIVYLNNPKFEILYESGINALLDGYYAESVLTMTAALERVYEFFIEIMSYKNELDPGLYAKVFKLVSRQSERQLGAFYFLYANFLKKHPPKFDLVEFRNKVIHKGVIPNLEDTEKYARHIFDLIKTIYVDAVEYCGTDLFKRYMDIKIQKSAPKLKELHGKYKSYRASTTIHTMLCHMIVLDQYKKIEFDSAIQGSKAWKEKRDNPLMYYAKIFQEVNKDRNKGNIDDGDQIE